MFSTWKADKFQSLYDAVQSAVTAGTTIVKWNAGDTGAEEQAITLTPAYIAAVNAEFEARWPEKCGRRRTRRTRAVFA